MKLGTPRAGLAALSTAWLCGLFLSSAIVLAQAEPKFTVTPVAEKKLAQLPAGPLYWLVETFPTLASAKGTEGPTSLVVEANGKVWMFALGHKGESIAGGAKLAEIGPVPPITATEYMLRITHSGGVPGAKTPVHSHSGAEAFYVLSGRMSQETPQGVAYVDAGQSMNGQAADVPMVVSSVGTTDLDQFVMFVVDAGRPFSAPAALK